MDYSMAEIRAFNATLQAGNFYPGRRSAAGESARHYGPDPQAGIAFYGTTAGNG